jgi:hypothetical protein
VTATDLLAALMPVIEALDAVLAKLEWFRRGGASSERQWGDVVGLLRVRSGRLDLAYLARWAAALGVTDLLERALCEAS